MIQVILVTENTLPYGSVVGNETNIITVYDTIPHSFQYVPYKNSKHWYILETDMVEPTYRKGVYHIHTATVITEADMSQYPPMLLTGEFINGFIPISNDKNRWNFMDENGGFLLKEWANNVGDFTEGDYAPVRYDTKWGYADTKGNITFIDKAEYIDNFSCGYSLAKIYNVWYYYDKNLEKAFGGRFFTDATAFHNDYAGICFLRLDGSGGKYLTWTYINKDGKYINDDTKYMGYENWYDECFPFENGFGKIYIKGKGYNFVDEKGHLFSKRYWFGQNGAKYLGMALRDLYKENNDNK